PRTASLRFEWEVRGRLREAWPEEWPGITPDRLILHPTDWRPRASGSGYVHPFSATFPIRVPTEGLARFEVSATVWDATTEQAISDPVLLRWEQIEAQPGRMEVAWAAATNPDYIRMHPIGPQRQVANLLARLRGGSSI